jgi:hypothetical protein
MQRNQHIYKKYWVPYFNSFIGNWRGFRLPLLVSSNFLISIYRQLLLIFLNICNLFHLYYYMKNSRYATINLTGEVASAKFIVFILTDGGSNPLSTKPKAEHANNYTTDAARDIFGFYRDVIRLIGSDSEQCPE